MTAAVELEGIGAGHGAIPILAGVDLTLSRGEVVAIAGGNGSGKTTLLRVIAGLLRPTSGTVRVADGCRLGMLFQTASANLLPWRSVLRNVMLPTEIQMRRRNVVTQAYAVLDRFGLRSLATRRSHALSGGQRQLVALAGWLLARPDILLLDEPFSMLDLLQRQRAREAVREVAASGAAVIIVTHDLLDVAELAGMLHILGGSPSGIAERLSIASTSSPAALAAVERRVRQCAG